MQAQGDAGNASACGWGEPPDALRGTLTVAATLFTVLLWASPVALFWVGPTAVWRTRSTADLVTAFPYLATCGNCFLWTMYGLGNLHDLLFSVVLNIGGLALNLSFSGLYLAFSTSAQRRMFLAQTTGICLLSGIGIILNVAAGPTPVGYLAGVVNVLMYGGPLAAAGDVVRTRSSKGMPLPGLILVMCASLSWFCFGLALCDVPIMIPNGLGCVLGVIQLLLYAWARSWEKSSMGYEAAQQLHSPLVV